MNFFKQLTRNEMKNLMAGTMRRGCNKCCSTTNPDLCSICNQWSHCSKGKLTACDASECWGNNT